MSLKLTPNDREDAKKKKLQMRKVRIDALHNKGYFNHNISVHQTSSGKLVVAKCLLKDMPDKDNLPCGYCLRFYLIHPFLMHPFSVP